MHLAVGTSGFAYKEWKGPFYPPDCKAEDFLSFYASRLGAVEINNTFYRMPTKRLLLQWADAVPDGFRFALKASQAITHRKRLKEVADDLGYFLSTAEVLGAQLGPVLFQLPPNLKKDLPRLVGFLELLPRTSRVALEFRHPTWFTDDVYDALRAHGAALCIAETDPGETELEVPMVATADWGYLRLRRQAYAEADLHAWVARVRDQGWTDAFVFFKHEDAGTGPRLAQRFAELFAAA